MVKVISLSEPAYSELASLKKPNQSFSGVVMMLVEKEKKRSVLDFAGAWPGPKEELSKLATLMEEDRKKFKVREVCF